MKYGFIQKLMWAGYKGTFKKQLSEALRESDPKAVMKEAHKKYKEILADVTEFEKGDRFLINILSCALLSSILLSVKISIHWKKCAFITAVRCATIS